MARIRAERRRRGRKRMVGFGMAGICAIGLTWLSVRPLSGPVRYDIPVAQVRPRPTVPAARSYRYPLPSGLVPAADTIRPYLFHGSGNFRMGHADITVTPKPEPEEGKDGKGDGGKGR